MLSSETFLILKKFQNYGRILRYDSYFQNPISKRFKFCLKYRILYIKMYLFNFIEMYDDDNDQLLYTELNENFNNYISSMLLYKYSKKSTEIVSTGQNIKERYFGNNDLNNPLMAVKVSRI